MSIRKPEGKMGKRIHRRDTEYAEVFSFKLFTLCPPRLCGELPETFATEEGERCHPEAIAEGSRFCKCVNIRDASLRSA